MLQKIAEPAEANSKTCRYLNILFVLQDLSSGEDNDEIRP